MNVDLVLMLPITLIKKVLNTEIRFITAGTGDGKCEIYL